jgi:hypothetical protein
LDLNSIKALPGLGTDVLNTFVTAAAGFVVDMNNNDVVEVAAGSALQAGTVTPDTTPPTLLLFELNMDTEQLYLSFDETVNGSATRLENSVFAFVPSVGAQRTAGHILRAGAVNQTSNTELLVDLDTNDMHALKLATDICTAEGDTVLDVAAGGIADMAGVGIVAVQLGVSAGGYAPDTIAPQLVSMDVDLNASLVILNFDEPVLAGSLDVNALFAQGHGGAVDTAGGIQLVGATTPSSNGLQLSLSLHLSSVNLVKEARDMWTALGDSYLGF